MVRWVANHVTLVMDPLEALLQVGLPEGPHVTLYRAPLGGTPCISLNPISISNKINSHLGSPEHRST